MSVPRAPSASFIRGDLLLEDDFNRSGAWHEYDRPELQMEVFSGVYRVEMRGGAYVWALNAQMHENVVIEIDTRAFAEKDRNGFGVMCRADPNNDGDGYYFLIGSDGTYSIRRGTGREVEALVAWDRSPAINTGQASNRLRVLCIDDYLALYVNDQFVTETRDTRYHRGFTGLAAVALDNAPVIVEFDGLRVWSASLAP